MPTVHEVLKASGLTDAQIAALDEKVISGVKSVFDSAENEKKAGLEALSKAEAERKTAAEQLQKAQTDFERAKASQEAAEIAQRSNVEFYENKITPALNSWETERKKMIAQNANNEAMAVFYKAQVEGAKAGGFIGTDAPQFILPTATDPVNQPRDPVSGQYVAGAANGTPGSPTFTMEQIDERLGQGFSNYTWAAQEYQRLTGGQFMPDSVEILAKEAAVRKLPFRDYVAAKYDFSTKQRAIQESAQKQHDEQIAAAATAPLAEKYSNDLKAAQDKWATEKKDIIERSLSSNPDVRLGQTSKYADITRAVKDNQRPDPLGLNAEQRRQNTRSAIHSEIAEHDTVTQ